MHAAKQLVDGLDHRALARLCADMHDARTHRVEDGPGRLEGVLRAGRHDGERRRLRPHRAAGHRGVDEAAPCRHDARRQLLHRFRRAGRHQAHHRVVGRCGEGAGVEQDRLGLRRVDDHQHERFRLARGVGGVGRRFSARLCQVGERGGAEVEAAHREAARDEIAGHVTAHRAESDETDLRHGAPPS